MAVKALGIVTSGNRVKVEGMQEFRPVSAFTFVGRYRMIDFPLSNLSNSEIERIHIYAGNNPRSLAEHVGTGRHYGINSKRGKVSLLFSAQEEVNEIYNTDIASFLYNENVIERVNADYVVIVPSYMVFAQNYETLLEQHIASGADITLLYHKVNNADVAYLNTEALKLDDEKTVLAIETNIGGKKTKNIFMNSYIMKKDLFLALINEAKKKSSMYNLYNIVNDKAATEELNVKAVQHEGYFAAITDFKSYFKANLELTDIKAASSLFTDKWPIYTRTNDACPTKYMSSASVKKSLISNGSVIAGTVENCIIGRGVVIEEGAVVKNSVICSEVFIAKDTVIENQVIDKYAKILHASEIVASPENPGYVKRMDTL